MEIKRSTTDEVTASLSLSELGQKLLGDAFDPNAKLELHVQQASGQRGPVPHVDSIGLVQFSRRERTPPPPTEPRVPE